MLVIRNEQLRVFSNDLRARFEQEACGHVQQYFPMRCAALGQRRTLDVVRDGLGRAERYGFQTRYDLLRYLNLLFEFSPEFESVEAFAWARPYLDQANQTPTLWMDRLMNEALRCMAPLQPLAPSADEADEDGLSEFDGLVWNADPVPADYVPKSITPELLPPLSGSDDIDDDEPEEESEEEEEEEEEYGGWG